MKINSYKEFCLFQNVSRETYEKFIIFHKTLIKWQNAINLISKNTIENIWERHFLDSAQLYKITKEIKGNIIDFGSGAQIKSRGRNSFAVSLSEHVIGNAPQIIDSIMGKPIPSAFEGRRTNCVELYKLFNSSSDTYPK